jgi:hypothetical protein
MSGRNLKPYKKGKKGRSTVESKERQETPGATATKIDYGLAFTETRRKGKIDVVFTGMSGTFL